ncbi:MAG: hypothetical protein IPO43_22030 [Rhodoferax sp.]|nr:hypothetical protein [Rhodoferax sp.]
MPGERFDDLAVLVVEDDALASEGLSSLLQSWVARRAGSMGWTPPWNCWPAGGDRASS